MTTKRQIIEMAYDSIGLASYAFDLQPEQIEAARRELDAMVSDWNGRGIRFGYPIPSSPENGDVDDESGVPDWALEAVYRNLAIRRAMAHGKQVTPMFAAYAKSAKDSVIARSVKPTERKMPGGHPLGAGHRTLTGYAWTADPESVLSVGNEDLEL